MNTTPFFDALWADYVAMTPQAERIKRAFAERGETILNDHIAFRTLALPPIGLEALEPHILAQGYTRYEPYEFKEKKLRAFGYLPTDPELPRIFLSELLVDQLSPPTQAILRKCAAQVDAARVKEPNILWAGPLWAPITAAEYQTLVDESEYAAWVATIGIRTNHFTISVTDLKHHPQVEDVLKVVESLGLAVNSSGGRVKGTPAVLLEQGSTMADQIEYAFADGKTSMVPTCYYEFAKRYPTPAGKLFQGFVAASADKIFESTDTKPAGAKKGGAS